MNRDTMIAAAERLGWKLDPADGKGSFSPITITGVESGVPVRIERRVSEYHLSTTAFIDPPLPLELAITHEGIGGALANLLGFKDVTIGDAEFDKSFRVVSQDPSGVTRLFTPEVKTALQALSTQARRGHVNPLGLREFSVSEGAVVITRVASVLTTTLEDIVGDIPFVVAAARALKEASAKAYR